jgi:hypothetical protein
MEQAVAILAVLIVMAAVLGLARIFVRRRFDVMFLALLLIGFWFVFRPAQLALGLDSATLGYLFASGYLELVLIAEGGALLWLAGFGLGTAIGGIAGNPVAALLPRLEQEPSPFFVVIGLGTVTALAALAADGVGRQSRGFNPLRESGKGCRWLLLFTAVCRCRRVVIDFHALLSFLFSACPPGGFAMVVDLGSARLLHRQCVWHLCMGATLLGRYGLRRHGRRLSLFRGAAFIGSAEYPGDSVSRGLSRPAVGP